LKQKNIRKYKINKKMADFCPYEDESMLRKKNIPSLPLFLNF